MIAAWMLYCSLCAVGLSLAAALAERVLLGGRGPVRLVWVCAVALTLLVPVIALRFAPRPDAADTKVAVSSDVLRNRLSGNPVSVAAPPVGPARSRSTGAWRAALVRLDQPLAIAWATLSLALAFNFFGGMVTLAWMRRRWQRCTVLGVPVFVSERTGPAVVGVVSPAIVLPQWVLALEPAQLALMLRHEEEHRSAGDGRLLTAAELALIVMPWNFALWWQILRLRVAVELDCDARVLQQADARSYGDLLLTMVGSGRGPSIMGATAFAERATQLDRRIRVLARHRVRTSRWARLLALFIGLAVVTIAGFAPRPPAPTRAPAPTETAAQRHETASDAPAISEASTRPNIPDQPVLDSGLRVERSAATRSAPEPDSTRAASTPAAADTIAPVQRTGGEQERPRLADGDIFKWLFNGIALTPDQEAKARDLLARLPQQQLAQELRTVVTRLTKVLALQAQRDSALRALLTSDADRAIFDARVAQRLGGARRFGGPGPELPGGAPRGGGRGARGGGPGARGPAPADPSAMADATLRQLFDGIPLTAEQEASARALITAAQQEMTAQTAGREVRLRPTTASATISMPAETATALLSLVSSDADRAKLRSRIEIQPR